MSVQAQAETEIVSGVITGIVAKGGDKYQVAVQPPGSQYTKNLWTKDPNLVQTLQYMIGREETFLCGVSHWTNQQNQPVRSLWINGVGQGAAVAQPQGAPSPGAPGGYGVPSPAPPQHVVVQPQATAMGGLPQQPMVQQQQPMVQSQVRPRDEREDKIHRQTATKVAVDLLKYLDAQYHTFESLIQLSERLVGYYEHGVPQQPQPQQDGQRQHRDPQDGYAGDPGAPPDWQPPTDDDIPF